MSKPNVGFSAYEKFHDLLDRRKYYEACLLIDEVEYKLRDLDEGGIGVEYQKLADWTAGSGQHDWNRIFASPDISFGLKYSIIESIHSNVTYEEPERTEAGN